MADTQIRGSSKVQDANIEMTEKPVNNASANADTDLAGDGIKSQSPNSGTANVIDTAKL
jgi:hypothetical protein